MNADALAAAVAARLNGREPASRAWDVTLEAASQGYSRVRMLVRQDMLNGHGTIHGGMIFSLADTAFAYACNGGNIATVAAQASILFLGPAHLGDVLVAEAQELALAGRSGAYSVHVRTQDGRVVAEFQGLSRTIGGAIIPENNQEERND